MAWGTEQYRDFVQQTGYDGMAVYPLANRLALDIARGKKAEDFILAFQQSYRTDNRAAVAAKGVAKVLSHPLQAKQAVLETAALLDMPHINQSLTGIVRTQKYLGGELRPVVVHPVGQLLGDTVVYNQAVREEKYHDFIGDEHRPREIGELQWQPTAELVRFFDFDETMPTPMLTDRLVSMVQFTGHGRAAFDTNHANMTRSNGSRLADPSAMVARLAETKQLGCFEFSIQPEFGGDVADLRDIMDGNIAKTDAGQMLVAGYGSLPRDAEVPTLKTEIPEYAFASIGLDYQEGHAQLAPMLRGFVSSVLLRR